MKNLLIIFAMMCVTNSFSQKTCDSAFVKDPLIKEAYTFVPPVKLLNKEIWTRVSNTRFECNYLRLAVEYQDFEYILYEMDGAKRELSRAREYNVIGKEIAMNTFNPSPYYAKNNIASANE